jgi:REP element-mobilizing transposase RayT
MKNIMGRYNRKSPRAAWWDYTSAGAYFITICTIRRAHYFGEIKNGIMNLSPCGVVADACWKNIPNHFPGIELGAFVVMPNHVHGILILPTAGTLHQFAEGMLHAFAEGTLHATSLPQKTCGSDKNHHMAAISPKSGTVSAIVRSYKSAVTREANLMGLRNGWQSRFYDRIIRDDSEYYRINRYIINNPIKWGIP